MSTTVNPGEKVTLQSGIIPAPPRTADYYRGIAEERLRLMERDAETMLEMRQEIGSLKAKINQLQQKLESQKQGRVEVVKELCRPCYGSGLVALMSGARVTCPSCSGKRWVHTVRPAIGGRSEREDVRRD